MKTSPVSNFNLNSHKVAFQAREYAIAKTLAEGAVNRLKIYELSYGDRGFLDQMSMNINLEKLADLKNISKTQLKKWKSIINDAICMSGVDRPQRSFLLVTEKKHPCGIITYSSKVDSCELDYFATWPIAKGKKVKLAGTTLLKTLFDDLLDKNINSISLTTLNNGPVDLLTFYKKMGFEPKSNDCQFGIDMFSLRNWFSIKSKELSNIIEIEKINNPKDYDLIKVLDIHF